VPKVLRGLSEPEALRDQIEVVVVNPDRREIVGHAEGDRVKAGVEAHHRLEPHLENVVRKQRLEVAFDGFPEAGSEGRSWHVDRRKCGFIHTALPEHPDPVEPRRIFRLLPQKSCDRPRCWGLKNHQITNN
jgi:hypothetical protein